MPPIYQQECLHCVRTFTDIRPMSEFDREVACEICGEVTQRLIQMPTVMNAALPDGTKRFDKIRAYTALDKERRAEKDKSRKERLSSEISKLTGV